MGAKRKNLADILIELSARAELFHAPDGTDFAIIPVNNHRETWPVRSRGFRQWLAREFFAEMATAPNSDALQSALNIIEARAHFDRPEQIVFVRVGAHKDAIYVDLADSEWRAIEIDANGWRIVAQTPIPFRRPRGMKALLEPIRGGKIEELRPFLNVSDDDEFVLTVSYELAAMRPQGPYPVLGLIGESGAAKSTFATVLRKLIDPNAARLRAPPREERDLFIAANNAWMLPFDNISWLHDWLSDALCRVSTGGGYATRELYSDQDEALFDAMRPVILGGIEDFIGRSDLADRAAILGLKNIPDDKRKPESEFWAEFERAQPRILGALLDGVAHGLRKLPETHLAASPRMADFALWATACETAFWKPGTFLKAYAKNIDEALATMIEADRIARAVQVFMATRLEWAGTAESLLGALKAVVTEDLNKLKEREWPATPRGLSGRVRRAAAMLRRVGIEVTFDKDKSRKRTRTITIARAEKGPAQAAADNETADSIRETEKDDDDLFDVSEPATDATEIAEEARPDETAEAPSGLLLQEQLRSRGLAEEQISNLTPEEALDILNGSEREQAQEQEPLPTDPVERWRKCFARLDPKRDPCAGFRNGDWPRIYSVIGTFLAGPFAKHAADAGWTDRELFGVHPVVGVTRPDCCGALMSNARGAPVTQVTPALLRFGNLTGRKDRLNVKGSVEIWNWKGEKK